MKMWLRERRLGVASLSALAGTAMLFVVVRALSTNVPVGWWWVDGSLKLITVFVLAACLLAFSGVVRDRRRVVAVVAVALSMAGAFVLLVSGLVWIPWFER